VNFDGPVRVTDAATPGVATLTVSFDAWKGVAVAPSSHSVPVLPAKVGPKAVPVDASLIASLVYRDKKAMIYTVKFSPDGKRLFATIGPYGDAQFWDVPSMKETLRIARPSGYMSQLDDPLLTPDWKTLYLPVYKQSTKSFERDGKKMNRIEYAGRIRVWDLPSGKEMAPLQTTDGTAPTFAQLAPTGRLLVCNERPGYEATGVPKDGSEAWDLVTGKKWKWSAGCGVCVFLPDEKTIAGITADDVTNMSAVKLFDCASGKEMASLPCTEKGRFFGGWPRLAPDGTVIAVFLGGLKGAALEVWFLDAKTLKVRGKLTSKGDPNGYGWGVGQFTPDGKHFIVLDALGSALIWDVAGSKLERTLPVSENTRAYQLAISPDSKVLAVAWMPKIDPGLENELYPDPQDLPQPRISLVDLALRQPTRILIAPNGLTGGLAFSPDGKTLAFGSSGAIRLFRME
jgi:WD40 repeat protein